MSEHTDFASPLLFILPEHGMDKSMPQLHPSWLNGKIIIIEKKRDLFLVPQVKV